MLQFVDETRALDPAWSDWARQHSPRPTFLSALDVSDAGARHVGVFVTCARTALGLRGWDDASEGAEPGAWALFDIEKMIRMALHQSGLAFEALTSPRCMENGFPARRVAAAAVTSQILEYYRDIAAPLCDGDTDLWRWRSLLTATLLARDGVMSQDLATLVRRLDEAAIPSTAAAQRLIGELSGSNLPERPSDYEFLNDLVVASRLDA